MPEAGPFGSASVVVFGLLAALSWGIADFGGGIATRRATLYGVVIVSSASGMAVALVLALVRAEPLPAGADLAWCLTAGVLGTVGIVALYNGLAVGRMAIVAPVTGVLAASIPVIAGIFLEGLPRPIVMLGIGLAIAAVVLVSRVTSSTGGRSGMELALVSGLGIGLFSVALSRIDDALVFGPLVIVRLVEAAIIVPLIVIGRRPGRVPLRLLPVVALVGFLDMAGNAGFLFAQATGSLAVAAVLSSLYPVTTVILAMLVLREPMTRSHAAGIALALTAIGLIASGSAP